MNEQLPTIVIRHKKENLKKCTLRGLETRKDFRFFSFPLKIVLPPLENYVLLTLEAKEELSEKDQNCGIMLLDATWRYSDKMLETLSFPSSLIKRRLPAHIMTAYPRRQTDCKEPNSGLASIEALFAAYFILKRDCEDMLDHYYWKNDFLEKNRTSFHFPNVVV